MSKRPSSGSRKSSSDTAAAGRAAATSSDRQGQPSQATRAASRRGCRASGSRRAESRRGAPPRWPRRRCAARAARARWSCRWALACRIPRRSMRIVTGSMRSCSSGFDRATPHQARGGLAITVEPVPVASSCDSMSASFASSAAGSGGSSPPPSEKSSRADLHGAQLGAQHRLARLQRFALAADLGDARERHREQLVEGAAADRPAQVVLRRAGVDEAVLVEAHLDLRHLLLTWLALLRHAEHLLLRALHEEQREDRLRARARGAREVLDQRAVGAEHLRHAVRERRRRPRAARRSRRWRGSPRRAPACRAPAPSRGRWRGRRRARASCGSRRRRGCAGPSRRARARWPGLDQGRRGWPPLLHGSAAEDRLEELEHGRPFRGP